MDTLTAIMSTAEAVNVAHAVGVRAWFLSEIEQVSQPIWWTVLPEPSSKITKKISAPARYFEQRVATHKSSLAGLLSSPPPPAVRKDA